MRSIISTVSISPKGFLPFILLLLVIIVAVVMVTVILVVVVVANVGVVIVVAIIGVFFIVMIIRVVVVVVVGGVPPIIKLSFVIIEFEVLKRLGEILIGQEPFQFGPGDLVGLFNSDRLGFPLFATGISLGPVFLLGLSAFAMVVSYASKVGVIPLVISAYATSVLVGDCRWKILIQRKVLEFKTSRDRCGNNEMSDPIGGLDTKRKSSVLYFDLTGDEDPTDKDGDIGVSVSLGDEIFSEGNESRESNTGDSDNTGDGGKTTGRAKITWGGGIASLISESEGMIVE
ncbi:hypothetical protein Tco_1541733 [Tanacetum coccineum]